MGFRRFEFKKALGASFGSGDEVEGLLLQELGCTYGLGVAGSWVMACTGQTEGF